MLRVKVGEGYSKRINVTREAPQGFVLGPIVALQCINDSLKGLTSGAVMFTDGVGTWRKIVSLSGGPCLQKDIDYLSNCSWGCPHEIKSR